MKIEEGWGMYINIKKLKQKGFSYTKIAEMLSISRPTVKKYASMNADEFNKIILTQQKREKKPDKYHDEILSWLKQYPTMTAAQVFDWLEEKYHTLSFNETTLRSYVRELRIEHDIFKSPVVRQYEAVEDPPMGKQMQVDFGQKKVINADGKEIILFVMCFVLSHSRYKYCEWQDRPFNSKDIIYIHEKAFEYFGGFPEEAVYDQDHLLLVSENYGDLIYTMEFASYLQKRKFSVYMCRKSDPESKGRIEKVVDFVKDNFASNRTFYSIDRWNEDCYKWLKRRGNGKIHGTIKKIPAEVFIEEKKYLQPITEKIISNSSALSITYQVRKDNTVPIRGNKYTVPKGTYKGPNTYVKVSKIGEKNIIIYDIDTDEELSRFEIPETKGNLVRNNNHRRDNSEKISVLIKRVAEIFSDSKTAEEFLEEIRKAKPRYIRDNINLIEKSVNAVDNVIIDKALELCIKNRLTSAVDFRDAVKHFSLALSGNTISKEAEITGLSEEITHKIATKPKVRDIAEYVKIMNESDR